eukprot:scaffold6807_cov220-Amphora_coffeaeformis.AAC.4
MMSSTPPPPAASNPELGSTPNSEEENDFSDYLNEYVREGFVGPIEVLSQSEAQQALRSFHAWASSTFPNGKLVGDARFKPHLHLPFCHNLVHHPKLVRIVQTLLQTPHILLWSSDFNIKEPKTDSWFPPHQDSTYAGLDPPDQVLTVWIALSEVVSEREGCLSFWKRSHRKGQLSHKEETDPTNMLSRGQRLEDMETPSERVSISLRGGQATIHNFFTVHQSGPNQSLAKPRIGLALRYMASTVRQTGPVRESATLVAGSPQHDGFDLEPSLPDHPTPEDIQRGKEAHADAMQRETKNYFQGTNKKQYEASVDDR